MAVAAAASEETPTCNPRDGTEVYRRPPPSSESRPLSCSLCTPHGDASRFFRIQGATYLGLPPPDSLPLSADPHYTCILRAGERWRRMECWRRHAARERWQPLEGRYIH